MGITYEGLGRNEKGETGALLRYEGATRFTPKADGSVATASADRVDFCTAPMLDARIKIAAASNSPDLEKLQAVATHLAAAEQGPGPSGPSGPGRAPNM